MPRPVPSSSAIRPPISPGSSRRRRPSGPRWSRIAAPPSTKWLGRKGFFRPLRLCCSAINSCCNPLTPLGNGVECFLVQCSIFPRPDPTRTPYMFKIDQFAAANEAAIEQFSYFAKLSLGNFEKFAELGLGAARESLTQATRHAQSLAGARDVHEVIAINSAAVEPALKRAYAYSRTAYDTAAATNDE